MHRNLRIDSHSGHALLTNQTCKTQLRIRRGTGIIRKISRPGVLLMAAAFAALTPLPGRAQSDGATLQTGNEVPTTAKVKKPPEQELIIEGEGSFGNYKIFAQGEDSKLFSSGVEYERHSWHQLLGAQVYYVAEFLPFVLLDQPAHLTFYGTPIGTAKQFVPGIGITPVGFRMLWRHDKAIKPYLMAKGGFLVFTKKAESPNASYENISLQSDIGLQIRMTSRIDFRMGMGDFHFSNAFVVPSNPGLDVMSWTSGICYHLGK